MTRVWIPVCALVLLASTLRAADERQGSASSTSQQSTMQTCTLKVSGMTCASCDVAVRVAAKTVTGVKTVKVDYPRGQVEITYDPAKTSPQAIADVITRRSGFKTERVKTGKD